MYIWEYWFRDNFKVLIIRLWWFWSPLSKASPKSISKVFQCGSLKISKIWTIFIFGHCFTKGSTFGFQKLWLHILAVSWTKSRLFNARLRDHLHHLIYICLPESKMTKMKVSIKFVLNVPLPSRRVALIRPKNNLLGSMFLKWCILFLKDNKWGHT